MQQVRTVLAYRKLPSRSTSLQEALAMGSFISFCPIPTSTTLPPGTQACTAVCARRTHRSVRTCRRGSSRQGGILSLEVSL